jgi:glycosyltransferase involved in cell wall biosynthesis
VYFIGFIDKNLPVFLNELDILIFPSLKEGLSLSLIEAMSMEKAVIVSKAGGMPEVVEEGKNGYIVDIGDAIAIKDKVLELIEDKNFSGRLFFDRSKILKFFSCEDRLPLFHNT